jgi:hypothetical protein
MDPAEQVSIPASHQDQVVAQPPGTQVTLASAFTPYAGLAWDGGTAISFQFHPEFDPAFAKALIEARRDALPDPGRPPRRRWTGPMTMPASAPGSAASSAPDVRVARAPDAR